MLAEELNRELWAREFAEDEFVVCALLLVTVPGYTKTGRAGRNQLVESAIQRGEILAAKFAGQVPSEIAVRHGFGVGWLLDRDWSRNGCRAQWDRAGKCILLSEPGILDLASKMGIWCAAEPDLKGAREVAIAHELFHALAAGAPRLRRSQEEIAAHAFARAWLGMPVTPLWFDWMTAWERDGRDLNEVKVWCIAMEDFESRRREPPNSGN